MSMPASEEAVLQLKDYDPDEGITAPEAERREDGLWHML